MAENKTILAEGYQSMRTPPVNLADADKTFFEREFQKDIPATTLHKYKNIKVLHEGLLVSGMQLKRESIWREDLYRNYRFRVPIKILLSYYKEAQNPYPGETLMLCHDNDWNGYFHWMTDMLFRLYSMKDQLREFVLVLPAPLTGYMRQTLEAFDIDKTVSLKKQEYITAKNLVMPSYTAPPGNYNADILKGTVELLKKHFVGGNAVGNSEKIYISRKKANKRKISNEDDVIPILEEFGYRVVCMEDHTFEEQVRMCASAKSLVSLHGAGLTNMMFMETGSTILEIRQEGEGHKNCYFSMASDIGLPYHYMVCRKTNPDEDNHTADIFIEPAAFRGILAEINNN